MQSATNQLEDEASAINKQETGSAQKQDNGPVKIGDALGAADSRSQEQLLPQSKPSKPEDVGQIEVD